MKELKLIDRIVVEIMGEQKCRPEFIAGQLHMIADAIEEGYKGNTGTDEDLYTCEQFEVLWEHECPEYGGFKIVGDKSLISQYYYHSELAPRIISEELSQRIRDYLDSFGDDLSDEEMAELFCQANALLSDVSQQTTKGVRL